MSSELMNFAVEQIVLGAILQNEENYWSMSETLSIDLFGHSDHQKIFGVIAELATSGRSIRAPIIAGRVGALSEDQSPEAYLSSLVHIATKQEELPLLDYVWQLRDYASRRAAIAMAEGLAKAAKDQRYDINALVEAASERLSDIMRASTIDEESTVAGTIRQILAQSSKGQQSMAVKPCLQGIEEMIGAFPPGSLVLWGGSPGAGKTLIAMQQLLFTSQSHPATLIELEMDNLSLVARSIAGDTGVSLRDIMRGMTERQYSAMSDAIGQFEDRKLGIVHTSKMTIAQLKARAYALKRRRGLDMLVVDHIKLVDRQSKTRIDPVERAYENARDLKALAKDIGCCVVALCQFTKMARQKEQPEPEMEDFYGGSLEEHADIMLANFNRHDWLKRNPPKTNQAKALTDWEGKCSQSYGKIEVYKLKDRFGVPRDKRIFGWDGKKSIFYDLSLSQDDLPFAA